ncbi:MAG: hypothetical protein NW237_17735 [Cyanobacteriota bacterium]|nr:hypothetical protein [Cyanobacteriota bacterium]
MTDPHTPTDTPLDTQKAVTTLKVVLGAAWADGRLQPEEIPSLREVIMDLGLQDHPEIRQWIQTPVSPSDYRRSFQEYLNCHPTVAEREYLLKVVTRLIYADDEVSVEEAYILDGLRTMVEQVQPDAAGGIPFAEFQALFGRLIGVLSR